MSPFRWDVLLVGFLLAVPVLALGVRGDFTTEEVVSRLPWCLAAGWGVVALLRAVTTPPKPAARPTRRTPTEPPADADA
ncbi:hypothetical protein [Blastococcus montanus]|uniref:hypothetical protein n=1 Tax=Blastococcus montanus TaxID=3144973 RepID=UPI00320AB931